MYLVNPSKIVVEVDDKSLLKELLANPKFRKATDEEIKTHLENNKPKIKESSSNNSSGFDVYLRTVGTTPDGYGQSYQVLHNSLTKKGIKASLTYSNQKIGILYSYPYGIADLKTPIKIIYTMFESTKIPSEWIKYLQSADKVVVPSKFCQKAFRDAGIESEVIPLSYDDKFFQYRDKIRDEKEPFTFLHYDAFNTRKGWDLVFKAFTEEFTKEENVKLIFKTNKTNLPFPIIKSEYPKIDIVKQTLPKKLLADLIHSSDCFVFPSRGEGFGLTPLEAMATGTPVIVPNGSGMSEYFNKKYFLDIKIEGLKPAMYQRFKSMDTGFMIEPSLKDLKKKMRFAFEHRETVYKMAREGAKWVKENYSSEKSAEKWQVLLDKYKKVEFSPDTEALKGTKTGFLFNKIDKHIINNELIVEEI